MGVLIYCFIYLGTIAPMRDAIRTITQHQVEVIRHHRIRKHFDPKHSTQVLQALTHPGAAVRIIASTVGILTTEKSPPHAARYAMINPDFIGHHYDFTRLRHNK